MNGHLHELKCGGRPMNKKELGKQILEEMILEEYETIIFDYLINNCVNLKDENIKEIVNLKCKQFDDLVKNINKLKEQQKEFINYLKSMLENEKDNFSVARVKDVLEKYKEIVGDK